MVAATAANGGQRSPLGCPRCDEIPDDGVEVLVLRGLLTATTSTTFALHGQVGQQQHMRRRCGCCSWLRAVEIGMSLFWAPSTRRTKTCDSHVLRP